MGPVCPNFLNVKRKLTEVLARGVLLAFRTIAEKLTNCGTFV
jgi:hypothetical protein